MKKIFFALFLLGSSTMFAQSYRNQPPANVRESFQRDNPNINKARWERNNNRWHATYKDDNNRNVDAYYDRDGSRRETHRRYDKRDVPREVDNNFYRTYRTRNYKAVRIERPNNQPLFQIQFTIGGRNRTVYMDEQGRRTTYNR